MPLFKKIIVGSSVKDRNQSERVRNKFLEICERKIKKSITQYEQHKSQSWKNHLEGMDSVGKTNKANVGLFLERKTKNIGCQSFCNNRQN